MSVRAPFSFLLALSFAAAGCHQRRSAVSTNPDLLTPILAARALHARVLYYNAPAQPWLAREQPGLVQPAHAAAFAQAVQDPRLFRKLDRELRFDTLWLTGDPSQFKPLLEHLLETKDFTLAYLDHTSLLFHREGPAWDAAQLDTLRAKFPVADQAGFLAAAATKLLAIRQPAAAKHCLTDAEKLDPRAPEVWSGWATYHLVRGEYAAALEAADRALALDDDFLPALACKTQALYATKKFSDAYDLSELLLARSPDDPAALFYHAKIAHEAHAYDAEIRTMQHLIALGTRAGASVSGYRVYLGQAYAAKSDADSARDQLTLALLDTELPREQRQFADQLLNQIQDRTRPPQ